jgi:histidyl-tRNA synthetase
MARTRALSGFPEWLPAGRMVEAQLARELRRTFELHSFAGIETRAVEPLGDLLRKGETSKEVYVLQRLQAEGEAWDARTLGLHFDLTVPLARYVLDNAGRLVFPFKRYQIQKVWRGERPQEGRFREFAQADIDIVARGELPFHYEVEAPLVVAEALARLPIGPFTVRVNNRKVSEAFYRGIGLDDIEPVLRWIDKLDKIGPGGVAAGLESVGASAAQAAACLELASLSAPDDAITVLVGRLASRLGAGSDLLDEGLGELGRLVAEAGAQLPGRFVADLKIARGLDYYTGSVYETTLDSAPALGSICSGGRYDNLVSDGRNQFPGVGLSVGLTRVVSHLLGSVTASRDVPAAVWVAVVDASSRPASQAIARALRARGIACDVSPDAAKYGKQIQAAARRRIPYVWFPAAEDTPHQVRDIRSGDQVEADPATWLPPADDLRPRIVPADG